MIGEQSGEVGDNRPFHDDERKKEEQEEKNRVADSG